MSLEIEHSGVSGSTGERESFSKDLEQKGNIPQDEESNVRYKDKITILPALGLGCEVEFNSKMAKHTLHENGIAHASPRKEWLQTQ